MSSLVIVESGAKGKKIQGYLGKGYLVESCRGHVQDLPGRAHPDRKQANKAMWASKEDVLPEPPWDWSGNNSKERENTERLVGSLISKAEKNGVKTVYIATDPDREGEFIAWRLAEIFSGFETKRVTFNEVTKSAVMNAIDNPREVDMNLVEAAKVRRFMDRLVGYRASKFSRSWNLTSMGRVQTPTLGILVERELERLAFEPQPYYAVTADSDEFHFKVRFHEKDDSEAWFDESTDKPKHHPDRTNNQVLAEEAFSALKKYKSVEVTDVKAGSRKSKPQPPFSTPTLLRKAGSDLNWTSKRVMNVANGLYQQGLITYLRTDSTRTSPEARSTIREYISKNVGSEALRAAPGIVGEVSDSAVQDAHEAIRPTDPSNQSPDGLDKAQMSLYSLIWSRFAASQMVDSEYSTLSVKVRVDGFEKILTSSKSWRVKTGWEWAFGDQRATPNLNPPKTGTTVGSSIQILMNKESPRLIVDETKPPSRLRQHTLVESMQKRGIGRPSTYASTVDKLLDDKRRYVVSENGSLIPTDRGILLWEEIAPMYGNDGNRGVFESEFTAGMEASLDGIEHGKIEAPDVWSNFVGGFSEAHTAALELRRSKPTPKQKSFLKQLLNSLSEEEQSKIMNGMSLEDIDGSTAKDLIEQLREMNVVAGASEKQMSLILRLCDQLDISLDDAAILGEVNSIDELTGGRSGSASVLISKLIEIQGGRPRPPTERQIKYLRSLLEKAEVNEESFCKEYSTKSIEELDGSVVSNSIQAMRERLGIKGRGRRKRK